MNIVVISDTHSKSTLTIPPELQAELQQADLLIHCGDFTSEEAYQQLYALTNGKMLAVAGNSDHFPNSLPGIIETTINDFKIAILHGHQAAPERLYRYAPEADLIIYGHQHHPEFLTNEKPYQLNPGSLSENRYLNYNTFAVLELTTGLEPQVKFVRLEK